MDGKLHLIIIKNICIISKFNVRCNVYVKLVLKDMKGCRRFYDLMSQSTKIEQTIKWMQELGLITDEEYKHFNRIICSIKEIRLKYFQYKVTNKILVTKSFLHKIKLTTISVNTAVCNLKQYIIFTIYHLFIKCEIVKRFWNEFRIWLSNNSTITIQLGEKQILFVFQDKRNTLRNYLCIIAKYYIYVTEFTRN